DISRVFVVKQKPVEFDRKESLNQFIAIEPAQFLINGRQIWANLRLIDFNVFHFFDKMVELLFANFLSCRDAFTLKRFSNASLQIFQSVELTGMNDRNGNSLAMRSSRPTTAVYIHIGIIREIVID